MKRLSIVAVACLVLAGLSLPFGTAPAGAATATTAQALGCGLGGNQTMTITGTAPDTAVQGTPFTVDLQPAQATANGGAIKNLTWYFQAPTGSSIVAGSATTVGSGSGAIGTVTTAISGSVVQLKASGEIPNGGSFRPPILRFQLNPTGAAGTNLQMKVQASPAYTLTAVGTIAITCTATGSPVAFTNTTIITAPGAPTIGAVSAGDGQATVNWTAPSSNGGSAVTGYVVTPYIGGVAQTAQTFNSTATSQTITGLTNGTAYTFKVAAVNAAGTGTQSAASASVTPATVPGAPTIGTATAGAGQATLDWTAPGSNGGSAVTGYVVTPYIGGVAQTAQTFNDTATSHAITGLTNGTAYTFKVAAKNAAGTGAQSAESNAVTPVTVPGAPTTVLVSAGDGNVTVSWTAPFSTGGSPITGYVVTPYIAGVAQTPVSSPGTGTSKQVTGLTNGTVYTFKVAAVNAVGQGADSAASNVALPASVPLAPTNITGTPGNGQVALSWTAAPNNGSNIAEYRVTPYIGATAQPVQNTGISVPSFTVSGLTNGTAYTFKIEARNDYGWGAPSAASSAFTPYTTPSAPTGVLAAPGNAQATVSWSAPSNGGSAITGYVVTPYIGASAQTPQLFDATSTSRTITGLTNGTAYTFKIAATNAAGTGTASDATNAVTPITFAGAPTGVTGVAGNGSVGLSWTAPSDTGGSAITGYVVTPYIGATAQTPQTFTSAATAQNVTGLTNGTAYTFKVAAVNGAGTGAQSAASAPITPVTGAVAPGAPTDLTGVRGNGQVTLTWSAPTSNGGAAITGYVVTPYIGATAQTPQTFNSTALTQTAVGLTNGTAYTFRVAAVNSVGTGGQSSATTAITPATTPGAPTDVAGVAGDGKVTVNWSAPASNGGSAITYYYVTAYLDGVEQPSWQVNAPATSWDYTGLTNGTAYTFKVLARNDVGNGPQSSATPAITPLGAPGAPTDVSATRGNGQATVTWTAPTATGGTPITGYVVTPYLGATAQAPQTFTSTATTQDVTGLTNGSAYTFKVAATNAVGTGSQSAASTAVTPATTPGAPTGVFGTRGDGQVTVTWTAPASDGGSAITSYTVTPYDGSTALAPVTSTGTGTSKTITGLANGTPYTFKVAATNDVGTGTDSGASAAVTPATTPGAPTGVNALPGDAQASVSWTAPASDGGSAITGYVVTPHAGSTALTATTFTSAATTQTVTGLTNGTAYTFTVAAVNDVGTGSDSGASTAVTPIPSYAPFASWSAFVKRQYQDVTAAAPSSAALSQWITDLGNGSKSKGDLIVALRASTDNTTKVDPAVRLYRAFFDRAPDPSGYAFWMSRRRSGAWTLERMAQQFATSNEFKTKYGTLSNVDYVTRIYTDVLGRPADPNGVAYWTRQLDLGRRSRGSVMVGFSESNENKGKQVENTDAAVVVLSLLGRAPTTTELAQWVAAQQGAYTLADLAGIVLDSPEYATHIAP